MDHVVEPRDFKIGVGHDREAQGHVLGLVDVLDPCKVLLNRIGRQAQRLAVALVELGGEAGGRAHFGGADRGEIGRVAEEEHPRIASPVVQGNRAGGGGDGEIGGGVADVQAHDVRSFVGVALV